jgi:hypothetical protein
MAISISGPGPAVTFAIAAGVSEPHASGNFRISGKLIFVSWFKRAFAQSTQDPWSPQAFMSCDHCEHGCTLHND